jgi:hypothetical protein
MMIMKKRTLIRPFKHVSRVIKMQLHHSLQGTLLKN